MPAGRVPVRGGVAAGRLSSDIGIASLLAYNPKIEGRLSPAESNTFDQQIRVAVNVYRVAHGGTKFRKGRKIVTKPNLSMETRNRITTNLKGPQTRTTIHSALRKVSRNAKATVKSGFAKKWYGRLYDSLILPPHHLANLRAMMLDGGIDLAKLKRDIGNEIDAPHVEAGIRKLASLDMVRAIPAAGHPDPPLVNLVRELMPVWERATKTSAHPNGKKITFGNWLQHLIDLAGLDRPSLISIARLVRIQKVKK